jgi:hypothetical protein
VDSSLHLSTFLSTSRAGNQDVHVHPSGAGRPVATPTHMRKGTMVDPIWWILSRSRLRRIDFLVYRQAQASQPAGAASMVAERYVRMWWLCGGAFK